MTDTGTLVVVRGDLAAMHAELRAAQTAYDASLDTWQSNLLLKTEEQRLAEIGERWGRGDFSDPIEDAGDRLTDARRAFETATTLVDVP
jgi:hypothetical protein